MPAVCIDVGHARPVRLLREPTSFEEVKTIATTNTQWGGTKCTISALVAVLGKLVEHGPAAEIFNPKLPLTEAYIARKIG